MNGASGTSSHSSPSPYRHLPQFHLFIMTSLDSMWGTSDLACLFYFPKFSESKRVHAELSHGVSPNHLHWRTLQGNSAQRDPAFVVTPFSPWDPAILSPPCLSIPGPAQPRGEGTGIGHRAPWLLNVKLFLWHCPGLLIFKR